MPKFEYNDELHSYALDDVAPPSVSAILKAAGYIDDRWSKKYPEAITRGTNTHKAIKYYLEGTLDEETLDDSFRPYFQAFKLFLSKERFSVVRFEVPNYHATLGYCGTADLIGCLNGDLAILDTKTGSPQSWHGLQLAAYERMEESHDGINRKRFGLYLKKDGKYRLKEYTKLNDYVEWQDALEKYHQEKTDARAGT